MGADDTFDPDDIAGWHGVPEFRAPAAGVAIIRALSERRRADRDLAARFQVLLADDERGVET